MNQSSLLGRFVNWRVRHMGDSQFILLLSGIVGLFGGLAAVGIKLLIHYLHHQLTTFINDSSFNLWYLILPLTGVILSVALIKYLYRGSFAHGITNVLYAISKNKSIVKLKDAVYFMFGSIFTVGLGGSVGMEATLIMTGSSLGSNLAQSFRLSFSHRVLLLGCGAAAALASFFHAPIAGVVFALEVLMLDLTMSSLVPLLMASVIGTIVGRIFLGQDIILDFSRHSPFLVEQLPYFVVLGLASGLIGIYFAKVDHFTEKLGQKLGGGWKKALVLGGLAALMIYSFPPLFGEGYSAISQVFNGDSAALLRNSFFEQFSEFKIHFLVFLLAVVLLKALAVAFTLGAGGIGGYFAPSLFLGGITGFLVARAINILKLFPVHLPEDNFTLVGMAGVMSSVFYAPLSAVFLIAEITSGYDLIVPLMLVATTSYLIGHYVEPHSLFTRRLARRGELITHHKDQAVMAMMDMQSMIENDFKPTHPDATFREFLREAVGKSKRNIFPVLDDEGKLISIVLLDDVRPMIFKEDQYDKMEISELMRKPPAKILMSDRIHEVLKKFDHTSAWNLPVVEEDGRYVGFISKSKLLSAYREMLVEMSYD